MTCPPNPEIEDGSGDEFIMGLGVIDMMQFGDNGEGERGRTGHLVAHEGGQSLIAQALIVRIGSMDG